MFKQSKNAINSQSKQTSITLSKTLRNTQNVPKDMLQFLARQLNILKDISQTVLNTHPDIIINRLNECIHLLQKKLVFSLSDNPEQYHDYIQDFYQNQMESMRTELNSAKIQLKNKNKELNDVKIYCQALSKQKQQQMLSLESSRVSKSTNLQQFQQNVKLKKQLEHSRMLLEENSAFIQDQAKIVQSLSNQLKLKQKQFKVLRQNHQNKIIYFDQYVNKYKQQNQNLIKSLTNQQKLYQTQLKQLALAKVRILQQKATLQKQLDIKIQEIQLLTKKVLQDEIMLGKLQKNVILKQKLIQELYLQIQMINGSLNKIGKKQGDYQKIFSQKNDEITKLQDRNRLINQTNQKLQKKILHLTKKIQNLEEENNNFQKQLLQNRSNLNKIQIENESILRKNQVAQKNLNKQLKQKQRYEKQLKLMQQRYQQLYQHSKQQKQNVKKQIMIEVNQLVSLLKQKQNKIKQLSNENQDLKKQLDGERQGRDQIEQNFDKMNNIMQEIQRKIDFLQTQNANLNDTKFILENQLVKINDQLQRYIKIQQKYQNLLSQKKVLVQQFENLRKNESQNINLVKSSQLQNQRKQSELEEGFSQQRKQFKQLLNKKQFQIKQLETKVRILQEEINTNQKIYDNEKIKMGVKIKQLEELLKQRYGNSSRFSQHSDSGY